MASAAHLLVVVLALRNKHGLNVLGQMVCPAGPVEITARQPLDEVQEVFRVAALPVGFGQRWANHLRKPERTEVRGTPLKSGTDSMPRTIEIPTFLTEDWKDIFPGNSR